MFRTIWKAGAIAVLVIAVALSAGACFGTAAEEFVYVDDDYASNSCGDHTWETDAFATIQEGIDAVTPGGIVYVAAGTYAETLSITKSLSLEGEGEGQTIIDVSGGSTYGIHVQSDSVTLSQFTLMGGDSNKNYGIHYKPGTSDQHISDVTVDGCGRTGVDFNGVNGNKAINTVTNLTSQNNTGGFGFALSSVQNMTITNLTTSGNAWGDVGLYPSNPQYSMQIPDDILFEGTLNLSGGDGCINVQTKWDGDQQEEPTEITISTSDENDACYDADANVIVPAEFNHVVYGLRSSDGLPNYAVCQSDDAETIAGSMLDPSGSWKNITIHDLQTGHWNVIEGILIQDAIDAASEGDTINVAAGMYEERVVINESLALLGATAEINKNGYDVPQNYEWDDSVESIINNPTPSDGNEYTVVDIESVNDVTLKGFVIQALDIPAAANTQNLLRVHADARGTCDSIVIQNNVIGPNTDLNGQDGTKGRMGLYLASPTYPSDGKGITNSTFSGNKIIDCLGNGNNVFVWGAAKSYNSPANADYTGTVIEDNEICGSHRSGIEIAGGVDNLIIRNNKIHGNSGNGGEENAIKYGNGILIIRMGSDKSSATGMGTDGVEIVDNLIYDNEKNGIYLGPINKNLEIVGNTFEDNGWDGVRLDLAEEYHESPCPVYNYVENIVSVFNNITGNTNCGIQIIGAPTNDFVLNATDNWWGCNDGPSTAENPTSGDVVSGDIDYDPWTCCCCDKANTGCSNGCCSFDVSITSGDEELVVTEVEVSGDATVSVAKFHDNPTDGEVGGGGILFEGAYYDLKIPSDCCGNITELVFKIKLPDNYTGTPQPQYYNGANWIAFDEDTYEVSGGYLVITLTASTSPSLSDFEGTAVAVAKASSPSPTPSGGSGGGCNAGFAPAALLLIAPLFFLRRRK